VTSSPSKSDDLEGASLHSSVSSGFRTTEGIYQERPDRVERPPFWRLPPTSPTWYTEVRSTVVASSTVTVLLMSEEAFFVQRSYLFSPALTLSTRLEN